MKYDSSISLWLKRKTFSLPNGVGGEENRIIE